MLLAAQLWLSCDWWPPEQVFLMFLRYYCTVEETFICELNRWFSYNTISVMTFWALHMSLQYFYLREILSFLFVCFPFKWYYCVVVCYDRRGLTHIKIECSKESKFYRYKNLVIWSVSTNRSTNESPPLCSILCCTLRKAITTLLLLLAGPHQRYQPTISRWVYWANRDI